MLRELSLAGSREWLASICRTMRRSRHSQPIDKVQIDMFSGLPGIGRRVRKSLVRQALPVIRITNELPDGTSKIVGISGLKERNDGIVKVKAIDPRTRKHNWQSL